MAPACTIRHPVCPIVALQRRMRFSARLAGFCRDRCHQRRARRADRASFSAFVSNPDFRVPRLRQIGWRAADRAVRRRKRGHPRGPESRPGLLRRIGLARSGPGAAQASLMPICPQAWIQVFARERGIPFLNGVSLRVLGAPKRMTERLLAEQDELRETFLFDGLHPALRERVQIRAPCGQPDGRDANRLDGPPERLAKLRVPVVNEVSARGQKADI